MVYSCQSKLVCSGLGTSIWSSDSVPATALDSVSLSLGAHVVSQMKLEPFELGLGVDK